VKPRIIPSFEVAMRGLDRDASNPNERYDDSNRGVHIDYVNSRFDRMFDATHAACVAFARAYARGFRASCYWLRCPNGITPTLQDRIVCGTVTGKNGPEDVLTGGYPLSMSRDAFLLRQFGEFMRARFGAGRGIVHIGAGEIIADDVESNDVCAVANFDVSLDTGGERETNVDGNPRANDAAHKDGRTKGVNVIFEPGWRATSPPIPFDGVADTMGLADRWDYYDKQVRSLDYGGRRIVVHGNQKVAVRKIATAVDDLRAGHDVIVPFNLLSDELLDAMVAAIGG
jgi:hypothetical protein